MLPHLWNDVAEKRSAIPCSLVFLCNLVTDNSPSSASNMNQIWTHRCLHESNFIVGHSASISLACSSEFFIRTCILWQWLTIIYPGPATMCTCALYFSLKKRTVFNYTYSLRLDVKQPTNGVLDAKGNARLKFEIIDVHHSRGKNVFSVALSY